MWTLIGTSAACLTMFGFVPQIFKVIKTHSVKDVSVAMILQFSLGVALWSAYGIHLKDKIIFLANAITLFTLLVFLLLYLRYSIKTPIRNTKP